LEAAQDFGVCGGWGVDTALAKRESCLWLCALCTLPQWPVIGGARYHGQQENEWGKILGKSTHTTGRPYFPSYVCQSLAATLPCL
jgi:hypothetical protein